MSRRKLPASFPHVYTWKSSPHEAARFVRDGEEEEEVTSRKADGENGGERLDEGQ